MYVWSRLKPPGESSALAAREAKYMAEARSARTMNGVSSRNAAVRDVGRTISIPPDGVEIGAGSRRESPYTALRLNRGGPAGTSSFSGARGQPQSPKGDRVPVTPTT